MESFTSRLINCEMFVGICELTRHTSQFRVASQVRVTSQVRVRFQFFFIYIYFFDYTNDVIAVTRNSNFPVGDIFHSRSKEPLPLRIAVALTPILMPILQIEATLQSSHLRHQYGIFGGKSQTSFSQNATRADTPLQRVSLG